MGRREDIQFGLTAVAASLDETARENAHAAGELESLLVRSRIDDPSALTPRALSVERATWFAPENVSTETRSRLNRLVDSVTIEEPPAFRVYRRETPVAAPMLDLATPSWGRGALARHSVGPLRGLDGRLFWFDFFPIVKLAAVHFAGDAQPAILFFERPHTALARPTNQHTLVKSSIWVRANLLTPTAPGATYVGLQVDGGSLAFSVAPTNVNGKFIMPAGSTCNAALRLSPSPAAAVPPGQAGQDAGAAQLSTPESFSFSLTAGQATTTNVTEASARVYGTDLHFAATQGATATFEPLLQSVVIPMRVAESQFAVRVRHSPFTTFSADADIQSGGWTLPVSLIDVNDPTEAAGSGGLAIRTGPGLTLDWRGLRDGPVLLPNPWIASGPGVVVVLDPAASNFYAHQRLLLWKDPDSRFRSEAELRYTSSFAVWYATAATGNELLLAQTNVEAKLDRPVDVKGTPFPVRTLKSLLSLIYTDEKQFAFLYDDNILVDSLDPAATWPAAAGRAISLAIHNALFTITPVNSLLLFAELADEENVSRATLLLGVGLYGLLPTLPDPYAANVTWLRRQTGEGRRDARPAMLLVAAVAWTTTEGEDTADEVSTSFAFAPLATQQQTIAQWTEAGDRQRELTAALHEDATRQARGAGDTLSKFTFSLPVSNQIDWDRLFSIFDTEQFALLDVSSNADQMGVSFAWFNERRIADNELVFYRVFKPVATDQQPAFPLQIQELDLSAQSRFVRAFTLPQVSWEPLYNLTPPPAGVADPPFAWNLYPNDGGPTRLLNDSVTLVPVAPLPVTEFLVADFKDPARDKGVTAALFTLPFGLRAFAAFSRTNPFGLTNEPARLGIFRPEYEGGAVTGALQVRADAPKHPAKSPTFEGATLQLNNVLDEFGTPTFTGTLGFSVAKIFNRQFYYVPPGIRKSGVPLSRIDFSGYGASIFSHWEDPTAAIAAASKAYFDVFTGRTAQEVIQVRSLLYPWGVRVVRTITLTRASDAYVFRFDTGWQAESEGIYDFSYKVFDDQYVEVLRSNPYEFHPGLVKGVFNVRNIRETSGVAPFQTTWTKKLGDEYLDAEGIVGTVTATTLAEFTNLTVFLQPVYFDADVDIQYVVSGAPAGRVPSQGMLGYVQLSPRGEPIQPNVFSSLLTSQFGALGGPVDCVIDIGSSGQRMRLSRVDVNASVSGSGPIFVSAARGALILPKEGAWSVVQHDQGTGEVARLDPQAAVPLIRRGKLAPQGTITDATAADLMRLANPIDLVQPPGPATRNYGLLQTTDTQKVLFRTPAFQENVKELKSTAPDFADAYRIANSKAIFPNVKDAIPLNLGTFTPRILPEGYQLTDALNPSKVFEQAMPNGPLFLVNEKFFKLYVEYSNNDKAGNKIGDGVLRYGFNAAAAAASDQWLSKLDDISMVVDLGSIPRLMMIKGKFDSTKGARPGFRSPELLFHDKLKPLIDILQILASLQTGDYKAAFEQGLDVAMSNSADSWNYALHARKEIPVVRFPPGLAYNNPTNPLKLEAHMAIGVYFNEAMAIPSAPGQLVPSAGAFLEFGGSLSVMCVSLAAATVYAVGSVELRTAADIKTGPSLHMKFGFGAEISVGLPVVGTVSVLYMVGVQIDIETGDVSVAAFLLFRGRAELIGGLVTVQIQIEAKGTVKDRVGAATEMAAQVTFGLDISIFLVINLHFSKSWEESRQIA